MNQSQADVQAIQARLREIGRRPSPSSPPASPALSPMPLPHPPPEQPSSSVQSPLLEPESPKVVIAPPAQKFYKTVADLERRSQPYLQRNSASPSPQSQPAPGPLPEHQFTQALEDLELQARRVNQLAVMQESAVLELKAIADRAKHYWKIAETGEDASLAFDVEVPPICEYLDATVPYIEKDATGVLFLKGKTIDLFKTEREAVHTAQTLRHRQPQSRYESFHSTSGQAHRGQDWVLNSLDRGLRKLWKTISIVWQRWVVPYPRRSRSARRTPTSTASVKTTQANPASVNPALVKPSHPSALLQDVVLWLVGAIVARAGMNWLLTSFPALWLPLVALIIVPAAFAVYRTAVSPQSSFTLGYRLLLVMIGLLIGGRL